MARNFRTVDYNQSLKQTVTIEEILPPDHLARFIVVVIAMLDLSAIYARYAPRGGDPYAPEILLGLLFYGYATGVFSSRKIERATYESIPFRFIAGGLHPDHDTVATFRKSFLAEVSDLFVQVLLVAHEAGILKLGHISLDGSKIHADASKSKAVSYKRLLQLEQQLRAEVAELLSLSERADRGEASPGEEALPEGIDIEAEIVFRQDRLAHLAQAKAVLELRAEERYQAEKAAYEAKVKERAERARRKGQKPRGPKPKPPTPGPRAKDQYNFTDPASRIMKNSTDKGYDQHYNVQVAVEQESLLIVANTLSNHVTDQEEAIPTLDAIPAEIGKPEAGALDAGYFSERNVAEMERRGIDPYIATGREPHHRSWKACLAERTVPPDDASPRVRMAYKLKTEIGQLIYGLRKSTVEPVIGIIKEVQGFRQFSLRGVVAAAGEWCLVCLAFNLKRLHVLLGAG
jgi:transposase